MRPCSECYVRTLEKMSVSVEVCSGTQTGADLLGKRKFDAVIVDCDDLSGGVDLLKGLRRTQSNASSVAVRRPQRQNHHPEAFQIGANFGLQKPLTPLNASRCFNAAMSFMVRERRRYFRHPVRNAGARRPGTRRGDHRHHHQSERGRNGDPL